MISHSNQNNETLQSGLNTHAIRDQLQNNIPIDSFILPVHVINPNLDTNSSKSLDHSHFPKNENSNISHNTNSKFHEGIIKYTSKYSLKARNSESNLPIKQESRDPISKEIETENRYLYNYIEEILENKYIPMENENAENNPDEYLKNISNEHDKWLEIQIGSSDEKSRRNSLVVKNIGKNDPFFVNFEENVQPLVRSKTSSGNRPPLLRGSYQNLNGKPSSTEIISKDGGREGNVHLQTKRASTASRTSRDKSIDSPRYHVFALPLDTIPKSHTPNETNSRFGIYNKVFQDVKKKKTSKKTNYTSTKSQNDLQNDLNNELQKLKQSNSDIFNWQTLLIHLKNQNIDEEFMQELFSISEQNDFRIEKELFDKTWMDGFEEDLHENIIYSNDLSTKNSTKNSSNIQNDFNLDKKSLDRNQETNSNRNKKIINPIINEIKVLDSIDIDLWLLETNDKVKKSQVNKTKQQKKVKRKKILSVQPDEELHEWKLSPQSVKGEIQFSPLTHHSPTNKIMKFETSDSDSIDSEEPRIGSTFKRKIDKSKISNADVNVILGDIQEMINAVYFPLLNGVKHDRTLLTDIITKINKLAPNIRKRMLQDLERQNKAELDSHELEAKLLQSNYKLEKANEQIQQLKDQLMKEFIRQPTIPSKQNKNSKKNNSPIKPKSISGPLGEFENKQFKIQQLETKIKEHSKILLESKIELLQMTDISKNGKPTKSNYDANLSSLQANSEINEKLIESQIKMNEILLQKDEEIEVLKQKIQQLEVNIKSKSTPNTNIYEQTQKSYEEFPVRAYTPNSTNSMLMNPQSSISIHGNSPISSFKVNESISSLREIFSSKETQDLSKEIRNSQTHSTTSLPSTTISQAILAKEDPIPQPNTSLSSYSTQSGIFITATSEPILQSTKSTKQKNLTNIPKKSVQSNGPSYINLTSIDLQKSESNNEQQKVEKKKQLKANRPKTSNGSSQIFNTLQNNQFHSWNSVRPQSQNMLARKPMADKSYLHTDSKELRVPAVKQISPFIEELGSFEQKQLFQSFAPNKSKIKKKRPSIVNSTNTIGSNMGTFSEFPEVLHHYTPEDEMLLIPIPPPSGERRASIRSSTLKIRPK